MSGAIRDRMRHASYVPPQFSVRVDEARCRSCHLCVRQCSFGALSFQERVTPQEGSCAGCLRCAAVCPAGAISVAPNLWPLKPNGFWPEWAVRGIWQQAASGAKSLTGCGNDKPYPILWDHLLLDAAQVTNPSIDPLREPMELRTYLGRKPDRLVPGEALQPQLELEIPIMFAAMSYGAVSLDVHRALAMAAREMGTFMNSGEGGLHRDLLSCGDRIIVQCASGRFGVDPDYFRAAAAVEIKIGQGAKPGIGGHLPGEKVTPQIAATRMIPVGTDAISPAPHHDIYSIEDLRQLIYAIKEAVDYQKAVGVKIAAVHNVAAIASGIVRAGADFITIDGFRGGTGASPLVVRDHLGIPLEVALAAVDRRLREEGIRHLVSLVASGGIRSAADALKAIALGADAVAIGTAALVALGCRLCQRCYTGRCAWGITTQDPELASRLDPEAAALRLGNLLRAWGLEIKEMLGAMGINAIESLRGNRDRLRGLGLDSLTLDILGVQPAGR